MIVALTGKAGAGKSTAAAYLVERHGFVVVKFAAPLKAMLRGMGLTDEHVEGRLKEEPCDLLAGATPRYAMQTLGTEWGRRCIGESFWVGLWAASASAVIRAGGRVVVDDCRFPNEAATVRELGGHLARVGGGFPGYETTSSSAHESEAHELEPVDFAVWNDADVGRLRRNLDMLVDRLEVRAAVDRALAA